MKKLKVLALALIAAAGFAGNLHAQRISVSDIEARVRYVSDRMNASLDLSKKQYDDIYDVNMKYAKKMAKLRESLASESPNIHGKMMALKEKHDKSMKKVLNGTQYNSYLSLGFDMLTGDGRGGPHPGGQHGGNAPHGEMGPGGRPGNGGPGTPPGQGGQGRGGQNHGNQGNHGRGGNR